jgi:hypothetical protein
MGTFDDLQASGVHCCLLSLGNEGEQILEAHELELLDDCQDMETVWNGSALQVQNAFDLDCHAPDNLMS